MEHKCPPHEPLCANEHPQHFHQKSVQPSPDFSNESLEGVNLAREEYEFSYIDGMGYHFMNPDTYEDITVSGHRRAREGLPGWEGNTFCFSLMKRSELPASITMEVAEAPERDQGDSANNVYKSATMTTGLVVQVPCSSSPAKRFP